jgi:Predicted membrane protein (DUF2142)
MSVAAAGRSDPAEHSGAGGTRSGARRWLSGRLKRMPRGLVFILVVAALQSLAWNLALPAFQGPDEDAHFAYVQHLAETGNVPSPSVGEAPISSQEHDALTYLNLFPLRGVLLARPAWSPADLAYWHRIEATLPPGSRANGSGPNAVGQNPPLYYALMAIPYLIFSGLPLLKLIFVLRLFNALLYLTTIVLTWIIAGDLFGKVRWKQVLAAGAVALEPQLAFMSAIINADNLLIALTTAFLLSALRVVMRGPELRRVLLMSVLCAAASLTHGRGLVTVPVLAVVLVIAWIRHRPRLRQALAQLATSCGTLAVAALLYLQFGTAAGSGVAYGGQVTSLNSGKFSIGQFVSLVYDFYFARVPLLDSLVHSRFGPAYGYKQVFIETFYGSFGWLEIKLKPHVYDLLEAVSAVGIAALCLASVVRRRALRRSWPAVAVMLTLLVVTLGFLHYVSYRSLLSDGGVEPLIVGRYLLPIVPLFGLAIAFTVGSLPRRLGPPIAGAILGCGVLLLLTSIGITMTRFYA